MCCWRMRGFPNVPVVYEGKQVVLSGYCADRKLLMRVYWHPLRLYHSTCLAGLALLSGSKRSPGVRSDKYSIHQRRGWSFNAIRFNSKTKKKSKIYKLAQVVHWGKLVRRQRIYIGPSLFT